MCKERSKTMPWHVISACPTWLFKGNASDRYAGRSWQRILILPKIWGDLVLDLYNLKFRNVTLLVPANARSLPTLGDRAYFQLVTLKLWNIFWQRSETFRALDLLKEPSKRPFLIDLFILFNYLFIYLKYSFQLTYIFMIAFNWLIFILSSVMCIWKYSYWICAR